MAEDGDAFRVALGSDVKRSYPATVVRVSEKPGPDLAVLHCDAIDAPPLRLRRDIAGRGTEVMVLGYPLVLTQVTLKSTRGTISGLPDDNGGMYAMDATANPGSSGGPICDKTGAVVAVLRGGTEKMAFNYSYGVPSNAALKLLAKAVPDFAPPAKSAPRAAAKDWPDVDRLASPATILILIQKRMSNRGLPAAADQHWEAFEDPCMRCGGSGLVKCPHCHGAGTTTAAATAHSAAKRVRCTQCNGRGSVRCPDCYGGLDKTLQLRGAAAPESRQIEVEPVQEGI